MIHPTALRTSRVAVSVIFGINGFIHANWVARLPRVQEVYNLTHGQLSLVLLALSLGALAAMPLTGVVIVRTGSRRLTAAAVLTYCILTPGLFLVPTYYAMLPLGFLIGMSTGALDIAMNAQAILIEEGMKKPIMSSFHASFSGGMLLGAATGAGFILAGLDLLPHLFTVCLVCLLAALWCVRHLIEDRVTATLPGPGEAAAPRRYPFKSELIFLGIIAFCCMLGEGAMADWSTNFLEKTVGTTRYWAPAGLVAFSAAMMLGRLLGDGLRARLGARLLVRGGALVSLIGITLVLWPLWLSASVFGFLLVGLGLANIIPIAYSVAGRLPGLPGGVGISMVSSIGYAGLLLGPPIIGFVADDFGLRYGLGVVLVLFVLMTALAGRGLQRVE
ncbi:MAG: MFS transporter [Saprospiraceae bacterium]